MNNNNIDKTLLKLEQTAFSWFLQRIFFPERPCGSYACEVIFSRLIYHVKYSTGLESHRFQRRLNSRGNFAFCIQSHTVIFKSPPHHHRRRSDGRCQSVLVNLSPPILTRPVNVMFGHRYGERLLEPHPQ